MRKIDDANISEREFTTNFDEISFQAGSRMNIPSRGFATSVEAGRFMGITRQAVSKLIHEGKIPHRRFGRALRIPWSWLLDQERWEAKERPVNEQRPTA